MEVIRIVTRRVITDFTVITRTVTPPGEALEAVLTGADPADQDGITEITAEILVHKWVKGTTPNPPSQRWKDAEGRRPEKLGGR